MSLENRIDKKLHEASRIREITASKEVSKSLLEADDHYGIGDYDGAIAIIERIDNWISNAPAQRVYGQALFGKRDYFKAKEAFKTARHLDEGLTFDAAIDEINIAAVEVAMKDYDSAWKTYECSWENYRLSRGLNGNDLDRDNEIRYRVWIGKLCIYNLTERYDDLDSFLQEIYEEDTSFFRSPIFMKHLNEDGDLVGVKEAIEKNYGKEIYGEENA